MINNKNYYFLFPSCLIYMVSEEKTFVKHWYRKRDILVSLSTVWIVQRKDTSSNKQVDASLQNQNLRTDLRRVAKRIRKFTQVHPVGKSGKFHAYADDLRSTQLCWVAKGWKTWVRIWAPPKSTQVIASPRGNQTKCKLNASRKLALTRVEWQVHLART